MEREFIFEIFAKLPEWNHLLNYGENDASWVAFLVEIKSMRVYLRCNAKILGLQHTQSYSLEPRLSYYFNS